MKKNLCMLLTVCLLFGFMNGAAFAASGFDDVGENDWFFSGVEYACGNEILRGVTETAFEPNSEIDRTTLVVALYSYSVMKGYDVSVGLDTNILSYDDAFNIREGACEAFQWACGSGLIPDEGATSLRPDETMSREQMVMLLYDYALLYGINPTAGEDTNILSYTDVFDINQDEAYKAFQWVCGAGIIIGTSASTLDPSGSTTRAQLATVLFRLSAKETEPMKMLSGTVSEGTMNTITVFASDGNAYVFNKYPYMLEVGGNGIVIGKPVTVQYYGELNAANSMQNVTIVKIIVG